jgi:hypothetical protein
VLHFVFESTIHYLMSIIKQTKLALPLLKARIQQYFNAEKDLTRSERWVNFQSSLLGGGFGWALAFLLIFPLFAGLNANGVVFPLPSTSFVDTGTIPVPATLISLALLYLIFIRPLKMLSLLELIALVFFILLAAFVSWIHVLQTALPLLYFYIYNKCSYGDLRVLLNRVIVCSCILFTLHLISITFSMFTRDWQLHVAFNYLFYNPIYSSYVSYISYACLMLISTLYIKSDEGRFLRPLTLLILLLSQRTMALIIVGIYFLMQKKIKLIVGIVILLIVIWVFFFESIGVSFRLFNKFIGLSGGLDSGRLGAWMGFLTQLNSFESLLFGLQNFKYKPHNYWLQLVNVGGVPLLILMAYFYGNLLKKAWLSAGENRSYLYLFLIWFLIDTNINAPFSQPYVVGVAMLILTIFSKQEDRVDTVNARVVTC